MAKQNKKNKFIEAYEKGQTLSKFYQDKQDFDFSCPNDFCCGRNGKRHVALAWKSDEVFKVYCDACGQNFVLSKEELRSKNGRDAHENAMYDMEAYNTKHVKKKPRKNFFEDSPRLQAVYDLDDRDKIQIFHEEVEEDIT